LIALWHGHALGELLGMLATGAGIAIQFPFPSLRYPMAHEIDDATERGRHPPFPSESKLLGHDGDGLGENGVLKDGTVGMHPPYPSDSNPVAQDTLTVTGMQFPAPSLVSPDGQADGSGVELGTQFPFPSLCNPDAQNRGIELATQFPSPSLENPLGHTVEVGGDDGEINTHPPSPSVVKPEAHAVN
jgi:hypothetical protein